MKKVLIGLMVTLLVVIGIVGYMLQSGRIGYYSGYPSGYSEDHEEKDYEERMRLWKEGCNKTGFALIRYNGILVEAQYEMHPNFR